MENNIQKEDLLALVKSKIYTIRGQKVMLDFDLAQMYEVETRVLNQSVKKTPYAFTENGVAMLSSVLRSPLAIQVNISIALAELQAEHRQQPKRKPIGFIQTKDDDNDVRLSDNQSKLP